jgi:hypothetical protein
VSNQSLVGDHAVQCVCKVADLSLPALQLNRPMLIYDQVMNISTLEVVLSQCNISDSIPTRRRLRLQEKFEFGYEADYHFFGSNAVWIKMNIWQPGGDQRVHLRAARWSLLPFFCIDRTSCAIRPVVLLLLVLLLVLPSYFILTHPIYDWKRSLSIAASTDMHESESEFIWTYPSSIGTRPSTLLCQRIDAYPSTTLTVATVSRPTPTVDSSPILPADPAHDFVDGDDLLDDDADIYTATRDINEAIASIPSKCHLMHVRPPHITSC